MAEKETSASTCQKAACDKPAKYVMHGWHFCGIHAAEEFELRKGLNARLGKPEPQQPEFRS